jgi:predicted DNA-binding transcriptional regulator AlpA
VQKTATIPADAIVQWEQLRGLLCNGPATKPQRLTSVSGFSFVPLTLPNPREHGTMSPPAKKTRRRFISRLQVMDMTGRSYPNIWAKMQAGTFPRAREIDDELFWLESEVAEWMDSRPIKQFKNDKIKTAKANA